MKFTKILALTLALMMLVCAFAACGGDPADTTEPVVTDPVETEPVETEPAETEADCKHTRTKEVPGSLVEATCTVDGKYTLICRSCDLTWDEVIPAAHTYSPLASMDGQYTRYFCVVCSDTYVSDANGAKVEDYSAIEFPFFIASFDDIDDVKNIADKFAADIDYKDAFATQVVDFVDGEETNSYANVPTGSSEQNKNGYFELTDKNNAFASKTFTVAFNVRFDEYPVTETLDILSWTIGGTEYALVKVDNAGNIFVIGNSKAVAKFSDKGWDKVSVVVDPATGKVELSFEGADNTTVIGEGKLGASATGKTDSFVRFFDDQGQFEAYIDEIVMSVK